MQAGNATDPGGPEPRSDVNARRMRVVGGGPTAGVRRPGGLAAVGVERSAPIRVRPAPAHPRVPRKSGPIPTAMLAPIDFHGVGWRWRAVLEWCGIPLDQSRGGFGEVFDLGGGPRSY